MTQHGCKKTTRVYFGAPPQTFQYNGARYGEGSCASGFCEGFYDVCDCGFEFGTPQSIQMTVQCPFHKAQSERAARDLDARTSLAAIRGVR